MGDLFDMNIEEDDPGESIRRASGYLAHIHLADSNRAHPGAGHNDFASAFEALCDIGFDGYLAMPLIIIAPTAFLRSRPIASESEEWEWALESIRDDGECTSAFGINLTLECWNRYGTHLLNRLEQAVRLWRETELPNGGVMADTYHMNIEERFLPEAIREAGELLNHIHLSDSNRAAPGQGHTDFESILQALLDISYPGYLTFELDVRAAVRSGAMPVEDDPLGRIMEQVIEHTRRLESRLKGF